MNSSRSSKTKAVSGDQDISEWRELTCHGEPDYIKSVLKDALHLCEVTRLARENETPCQQRQRLKAKNDKTCNMISAKEARKAGGGA